MTRVGFSLMACVALGCAASVDMGSTCPPEMPSCTSTSGSGGAAGSSGFGGVGGFAAIDGGNQLTAWIQEQPSGLTVTMVTLSCSGECANVIAVASGGNAPYTFTWNDGITTAARELCTTDTTTFSVTVIDTAIDDPEFHYDAQTATAAVTANVIECPIDGGMPTDGGTPTAELCISNPSFEGTPARNLFGATFDAAPWQVCSVTPDITSPSVDAQYLAATDGSTYLGLLGDSAALTEAVGQPLCAPLRAGQTASLLLDVTGTFTDALRLQLHGSSSAVCGEEQLLAEIDPGPTHADRWATHCVTLTATSDVMFLKVKAIGSAGPYIMVDNLRPTDSCP